MAASTGLNSSNWRETRRPASTLARTRLDRELEGGGGGAGWEVEGEVEKTKQEKKVQAKRHEEKQ